MLCPPSISPFVHLSHLPPIYYNCCSSVSTCMLYSFSLPSFPRHCYSFPSFLTTWSWLSAFLCFPLHPLSILLPSYFSCHSYSEKCESYVKSPLIFSLLDLPLSLFNVSPILLFYLHLPVIPFAIFVTYLFFSIFPILYCPWFTPSLTNSCVSSVFFFPWPPFV